MRVLLVNKFWYPKGGSERYTFLLKDLLESHGHEVVPFAMEDERNLSTPWAEFFAPHVDFWGEHPNDPNTIRMIRIRPEHPHSWHSDIFVDSDAHLIKKLKTVLWNRVAAERLDALLQEWKPDIAHLQNFSHQISPSILPVLARHGIPIVWTLHDYELLCPNYRMYTKGSPCERCKSHRYWNAVRFNCMGSCAASVAAVLEHAYHAMNGVYRKYVDAVIAPSRFLAGKLAEWGWKGKVEVIPNFIKSDANDANGRANDANSDSRHSDAFVDSDVHPVLFVGRLQEEKGIEDFMEAAERCPEIAFAIIGDGPLSGEVRKRMTRVKNLVWQGVLPVEETAKRIAAARIVVVPSRWYENAPYVVLEAMAAGIPVIATCIGGLPELVRENETGLLVPPRDAEALAVAVQTLYSDPLRCRTMGDRAQEIARTEYGPDRHYERITGVYREAMKAKRKS